MTDQQFRYKAFISYSHAADGRLAPAIQKGLHAFAKPWYRIRAMRVFRDDTNLSLTPDLWSSIESALAASEYFLLLASPSAASSKWIRREIDYWLANKSARTLLIVVTDGTLSWDSAAVDFDWRQTTAIPAALRDVFQEEPLYLDFRDFERIDDLSLHNPVFAERIASISATVLGRPKDELIGSDVRERRRTRRSLAAFISVLVLVSIAAAWGWWTAETRLTDSQAHQRALRVQLALNEENTDRATAMAMAADLAGDNRPIVQRVQAQATYYNAGTRKRMDSSSGGVRALATSFDGRRALSGNNDGSVTLWDLNDGRMLRRFEGHRGAVTSVSFSADARRMLSASQDGTIRLRDVSSGDLQIAIDTKSGPVYDAIFGPGEAFAISGSETGVGQIWRLTDGRSVQQFASHGDALLSLALSPDGATIVYGTRDDQVCAWSFNGTRALGCAGGWHSNSVKDVDISADGVTVISGAGGWDCGVNAWTLTAKGLEHRKCFQKHNGGHNAVALNPRYRLAISGSDDNSIVLWRMRTHKADEEGVILRRYRGHSARVTSVAFLADGRQFLSGSADGTVRLWDLAGSAEIDRFDRFTPNGFAVSQDGRHALMANVRTECNRSETDCSGPQSIPNLYSLSPDLREVLRLPTTLGHEAGPIVFSTNAAAALLASGTRVLLVAADTGHVVTQFQRVHRGAITSVALTPNGQRALTGAYSPRDEHSPARYSGLLMWDVNTGSLLHRLRGHEGTVRALAISSDGRYAVTGADDGFAILWDLESAKQLQRFANHGDSVSAVAFGASGQIVVTAGTDHLIRIWSFPELKLRHELRGHTGAVGAVAITPDERWLLSGSSDGTLRLWDIEQGREHGVLSGLDDLVNVREISITANGEEAYTRSWDRTVRRWRIQRPTDIRSWALENRYIPEPG